MSSGIRWSFTSRKTLDQCEFKFYRIHVAKDVKNAVGSPALEYGNRVHKSLETSMLRDRPLPKDLAHCQWALDYVRKHPGVKVPEQFLTVDRSMSPCKSRDTSAFNTAKIDAVSLRVADADVFDYKTGKHSTDMTQLCDSAVMVFAHFPTVVKVTGHLVFTEHEGLVETETFYRESVMDYNAEWFDADDDVKAAIASGLWSKTQSGLCGYCPVSDCENHPGHRA